MVRQQAFLFLVTNVEGVAGASNVIRQTKGSATKTLVSCSNIIKLSNSGMDGVDIMDQKTSADRLDRKSKYCFYLRMFFDFIDVTLVNSHIVYTKLGNDISLLNFKIVVIKAFIDRYSNRKRFFPISRHCKRKSHESSMLREVSTYMPKFQEKQMRCHYCKNEGSERSTEEKHRFLKHHL